MKSLRRKNNSVRSRVPVLTAVKCVLYFVNNDHFFYSHRLPLAKEALSRGWRVIVLARENGWRDRIEREGVQFVALPQLVGVAKPFQPLLNAFALVVMMLWHRVSVVHAITIRPVMIASVVCRALNVPTVFALSGLGYAFTTPGRARVRRFLAERVLKIGFQHKRGLVILQNRDDLIELTSRHVVEERRVVIVPGVGVDCNVFKATAEPLSGPRTVAFIARLLKDKGVLDFVAAAKLVRDNDSGTRFLLVGDCDPENPTSVSRELVENWVDSGVVEWLGHRDDVAAILATVNLVVLPSYREGLPKTLLEAGASARACIATDVPGCRDVIRDRWNGLLVQPASPEQLASAIRELVQNDSLRLELARNARALVEREFTTAMSVARTFRVYQDLLSERKVSST